MKGIKQMFFGFQLTVVGIFVAWQSVMQQTTGELGGALAAVGLIISCFGLCQKD